MITIERYSSADTYARHLIVRLGKLGFDLALLSLRDEGCDSKFVRLITTCGRTHRTGEIGITRDHYMLINQTFFTTAWRPYVHGYKWQRPLPILPK